MVEPSTFLIYIQNVSLMKLIEKYDNIEIKILGIFLQSYSNTVMDKCTKNLRTHILKAVLN